MCVHIPVRSDLLGRKAALMSFADADHDCCDYIELENCSDLSFAPTDLCCMQLNIRGLNSKDEFRKLVNECVGNSHVDIIMLQETWLTQKNFALFSFPGYKHYGNYQMNKKGGGVSILIKSDLKLQMLEEYSITKDDLECCVIEVDLGMCSLIVQSIY